MSVTLNVVIKWLMQVTPAISGERGLAARLLKRAVCGLEENSEQAQWRAVDHPEAELEAREVCRPPELCN